MLSLSAPAKINLYLRVVGKRPDGFHEIETLFERIDLADTLTFRPGADGSLILTCSVPSLSCGEDNLIVRAARQLQQETGTRLGAAVHLEKRIPVAAGLGGGSSDCATALVGLNRLWNLNLPVERLHALAARLGSDVNFFLHDTAFACGFGRGERCEPEAVRVQLAHVLVVPRAQLSTVEIYAAGNFGLTAQGPSLKLLAHALRNGSLGELAAGLRNDLEPEAIRRCPIIRDVQQRLMACGAKAVRLSGSGPSVFGLFARPAAAAEASRRVQKELPDCRVFVVQTNGISTFRIS